MGEQKDKLLTEIADMINLIPKDSYKYGKDVSVQILTKIREAVEGTGLTDEEINPCWEIWNKEHYEELHNAGNENRNPILIKDNTVFLETEHSRVYKRGMEAQLQATLKALGGEPISEQKDKCPECEGEGETALLGRCWVCDGTGKKKKPKVLVDGEWHEISDEFMETVRSIDEGLKRRDSPDREKDKLREKIAEEQDKLIPEELEKARAYLASMGYNLDYEQVKEVIKAYLHIKAMEDYRE